MKFYTKALIGLSCALLLTGCNSERTVKSKDAADIASKLSFSDTGIVSGTETSKVTSLEVEGGISSLAQKEANELGTEDIVTSIEDPSIYMVSASSIRSMGDKNATYKVNGNAITIEDTYVSTTLLGDKNYDKEVEVYIYASNGMLEKLISTSTCGFVDNSSYTAVIEYTYVWETL